MSESESRGVGKRRDPQSPLGIQSTVHGVCVHRMGKAILALVDWYW